MNNIATIGGRRNVIHNSFRRGIIRRIADRIKYWNERRKAIRQLTAMSDRLLQDIGIERHEIYQAVYRPGNLVKAPVKTVSERTRETELPRELRKAA